MNWNYLDTTVPFTYCWKIERFRMGMSFRKEWLYSSPFTLPYTNTSWKMMLNSNFVSKADRYVSIYLRRMPDENLRENRDYDIKLSIVSFDGSDKKSSTYCGNTLNFDYLASPKFISWKLLLREKEMLLPKDILTIHCVIMRYIFCRGLDYSFVKCFYNIYDEEERRINGYESENDSTDLIPNKQHKIPILHMWFEYLYSEKLKECSTLSDIKDVMENVVLKNTCKWPNGIPTKFVLNSRLKTENTVFTWYIKDFSRLSQDDKFFSPAFRCGPSDWKLLFHLSEDNGVGIAEIFICPMTLYFISKKIIRCRISVINRDGRMPLSQESIHLYDGDGHWRFPSFIQTETLNCNKDSYLMGDILSLYCTISVSEGKYDCEQQSWKALDCSETAHSQQISLCRFLQLKEDLLHLFEMGLYSDMIVKVGQTEIPVHEVILSDRSRYFKNQIKTFKEVNSDEKVTIEILDHSEDIVRKLLIFIYSGKLDKYRDKDAFYAARDYYGVDERLLSGCIIT